jgi:hypothetical protein
MIIFTIVMKIFAIETFNFAIPIDSENVPICPLCIGYIKILLTS